MKYFNRLLLVSLAVMVFTAGTPYREQALKMFHANNPDLHYTGRIDFSNQQAPRFWAGGIYVKAKFKGPYCDILINDQVPGNNNHNYIEIAIDNQPPYRLELTGKENVIKVPDGLANTTHVITICKDTESNIGYVDFIGLKCEELLPLPPEPRRKMEFIGNSITSGAAMDQSKTPCNTGAWFDQHNAYMSYGAVTARNLNAQWHLTSVSGIGLIHSCCNMAITMPQVFNKVDLNKDSIDWDFKKYQPDVVTICLGQNDGKQDSTAFTGAYIKFVGKVRDQYPDATIICLSSPMADAALTAVLKRYITSVTQYENNYGDKKVYHYFFSKQYHKGCGGHPDVEEHQQIAEELTAYIKRVKGW